MGDKDRDRHPSRDKASADPDADPAHRQRQHGSLELVWSTDRTYEARRQRLSWNKRVAPRYPRAIARPRSVDDVVSAVHLARKHRMRLGVCSGGHSWINASLCDDGLVIDLSAFDGIQISPESNSASVGPAATSGQLIEALGHHRLAFPAGHCPSVALGGYLLAGGFGWNSIEWGPAAMSVRSIDVVMASGEIIRADADRNSDLFWLARGSGAAFPGIVIQFELAVQPGPGSIGFCQRSFRIEDIDPVADWITAAIDQASPPVEVEVVIKNGETTKPLVLVTSVAFGHDAATTVDALDEMEKIPCAASPMTVKRELNRNFTGLYAYTNSLYPPGHRWAADNFTTDTDFASLLRQAVSIFDGAQAKKSFFLAGTQPASPQASLAFDGAFSLGGKSFMACYAVWDEDSEDDVNAAWIQRVTTNFDCNKTGRYIGEADFEAGETGVESCFSRDAFERIKRLRAEVDPAQMFVVPRGIESHEPTCRR
jgi:FAD/FMN-containing dehydrogenase